MGTNYYWHTSTCPACGHSKEKMHIGKSSGGWCFSLHVEPPEIATLDDWRTRWRTPDTQIVNEYGDVVTPEHLEQVITERSWPRRPPAAASDISPEAVPGPHGLSRHRLGAHCIGHGPGTWDYIVGDFS